MSWEVRDHMGAEYDELWVVDIRPGEGPSVVAVVQPGRDHHDRWYDRAYKLAAANELLAACKCVLSDIENGDYVPMAAGLEGDLRAAIAKANGEPVIEQCQLTPEQLAVAEELAKKIDHEGKWLE